MLLRLSQGSFASPVRAKTTTGAVSIVLGFLDLSLLLFCFVFHRRDVICFVLHLDRACFRALSGI